MMIGMRAVRSAAALVAACAAAVTLAGCAQASLTAAERSRATTLPTPTVPGVAPQRLLADRVRGLLDRSTAVSVDEDLQLDGTEQLNRVSWTARGTVLDASLQTLGGRSGTEVFHGSGPLLARPIGLDHACWWPAGPGLSRFDRPTAQDLAVLRSAHATSGTGSLLHGSVAALSALRVVGTDAELRRRDLLPPSGVRVAATFDTTSAGVLITMRWADLVAAAGNSSRHGRVGTWTLRFQTLDGVGPKAPAPGRVLQVSPADPAFRTELAACNARPH